MKKVLIIAEAVTLAHVVRAISLAQNLREEAYKIILAYDKRFEHLCPSHFQFHHLPCLDTDSFVKQVNQYKFPYSKKLLNKYIDDELKLFNSVKPDLVYGDFRLTLAISCRKLKISYISVTNSYYLPDFPIEPPPPDIFFFHLMPASVSKFIFKFIKPVLIRSLAKKFNAVAREHSILSAQGTLPKVFSQADHILVPESKDWISQFKSPETSFIGPLFSEITWPEPKWWKDINWELPTIYISVGSSGSQNIIDKVLSACNDLDLQFIIAGVNQPQKSFSGKNIYFSQFINNSKVMAKAHLMISNGGSLSMQDSFRFGKPLIGITSNYDQLLNMNNVELKKIGKGFMLSRLDIKKLRFTIKEFLNPDEELEERLAAVMKLYSSQNEEIGSLRFINRRFLGIQNFDNIKETPYEK